VSETSNYQAQFSASTDSYSGKAPKDTGCFSVGC